MPIRRGLRLERQLIRDTFRQARATGIMWMMLGVTAVCVALCLSVSVSGDAQLHRKDEPSMFLPSSQSVVQDREGLDAVSGKMTLAFGAVSFPLGRDRRDAVIYYELILAWGMAGTLGVLLTLVWTAGFLPGFLEPSCASVMLAKPVARWRLLLAKYVGVLTFVAFQAVLFIGLTWLAIGIRTDIWETNYWWCVPLLLLQFAVFYSFSVFLAVMTRSTVACVFGSLLFWMLSWGVNYGSAMLRGAPEAHSLPSSTVTLANAAYWITPKPVDSGLILFNALAASDHFEKPESFTVLESGGYSPELSVLSTLLITAAFLALAGYELRAKDY